VWLNSKEQVFFTKLNRFNLMCFIKNIVFSYVVTKMIDRTIKSYFSAISLAYKRHITLSDLFQIFRIFSSFQLEVFLLSKANSATLDLIDKN
jgi:hypothetical protein